MLEGVIYLKHLLLIFLGYNLIRAFAKPIMLRYFEKNLISSILTKL